MKTPNSKPLKLQSIKNPNTQSSDDSSQFSQVKNFDSHIKNLRRALNHKREDKSFDSPYQSSFTLQQSIQKISFSKAARFPQPRPKDQISSAILLPSTLKAYKCNLGFGHKNYLPQHVELNAKEFPSPSAYLPSQEDCSPQSPPSKSKKGPSFGISYAYYGKTYIPGNRIPNLELNRDLPGPGKYERDREIGDLSIANRRRVNITIKPKRTDFIEEELKKDHSPKKYYFPIRDLVYEKRFNGVGFGKGDKFDFTYSPAQEFPGPGHYESQLARPLGKIFQPRSKRHLN